MAPATDEGTTATAKVGRPNIEGTPGEVFYAFLKLGLTSFGGPVAHLGYFRDELVKRRGWIDEAGYADLVALCQFLPGPASSQVGYALGLLRAGRWEGSRLGAPSLCHLPRCWSYLLSAQRFSRGVSAQVSFMG